MRTQRMDLMQIHNLVDVRTHTATLKEWKQQERVRYVGVTHYHEGAYDQLETLIRTREYDFVQLNFSLSEREAEERVLPLAQEMGVAVIANRPFAKASLFGRVRGKALPGMGEGIRLRELGAVLPQIHRLASGYHLRNPGDQQTRPCARQPEGRLRPHAG